MTEEKLDERIHIHPTVEDETCTFWWLVPGDGGKAFNLGEIDQVKRVWQMLGRLIVAGEHEGVIASNHWQIAHQMTTGEAAELYGISTRTLRSACANGLITAEKMGKTWVMNASSFHNWRLKWPRTRGKT